MAQRIVHEKHCDWCGQLDSPRQTPAVHVRNCPGGKEVDLCEACCMMFDWGMPRIEVLIQYFKPEVIERLMRVGRDPADGKSGRRPSQLPLPDAPAPRKATAKKPADPPPSQVSPDGPSPRQEAAKRPPAPAPAPTSDPRKKAIANRGRWKDGVDQVLCPLDHKGANSPKEYWVDVRNRGQHAKSSHKGLFGPQIAYELPPDATFSLDVKCTEHKVCKDAGGYGFTSHAGLAMHKTKAGAEGWEPASTMDTAET